MVTIEKNENYSTIVGKFREIRLVMYLSPKWKTDEESMREERWNWPVKQLEEVLELIERGMLRFEEGFWIKKEDGKTLNPYTNLAGGILLKPLLPESHKNALQFIMLYKEELNFARKIGWRKLKNMFKFLTPEEINFVSTDRYNIITDVDGRRNCF